jgi:lysophospholipase L1-like esterase
LRRKRKWTLRGLLALLLVGSLTLIVALAELAARAYGLGSPVLYYENQTYRYAVRPEQSVERVGGARIEIDKFGLRTLDDWEMPGAERILFVGDSVTYGGSYVDTADLFSSLTCGELRTTGVRVVCGNAGTNGYGTDNMALRVRFGPVPEPDIYVVTVISHDALRGTVSLTRFPYFSKPPPRPVPALAEASLFLLDRVRARLRFAGGEDPSPATAGESAEVAGQSLDRLFVALRERVEGVRVLLVHSPLRITVERGYNDFDRAVVEHLRSSGFPVLEMRRALVDAGTDPGEVYHDGVHLTPAGHRFYAERITESLRPAFETGSPRSSAESAREEDD